jgi:hypothetical protein
MARTGAFKSAAAQKNQSAKRWPRLFLDQRQNQHPRHFVSLSLSLMEVKIPPRRPLTASLIRVSHQTAEKPGYFFADLLAQTKFRRLLFRGHNATLQNKHAKVIATCSKDASASKCRSMTGDAPRQLLRFR